MKKIILILSLCISIFGYAVEKEEIKPEEFLPVGLWQISTPPNLENVFDIAELCLNNNKPVKAFQIYKQILDYIPKKTIAEINIDGCTGEFIANAGICRAGAYAYNKKRESLTSNDYCLTHGQYAYKLVLNTPYSCNNTKRLEKLLWALTSLSHKQKDKEKYTEHALQLSSKQGKSQSEKRVNYAWNLFVHGKAVEAGSHFDAILSQNPRLHPSAYEKAGIVFAELEDYRKAVECWLTGMRLMTLNFLADALKTVCVK